MVERASGGGNGSLVSWHRRQGTAEPIPAVGTAQGMTETGKRLTAVLSGRRAAVASAAYRSVTVRVLVRTMRASRAHLCRTDCQSVPLWLRPAAALRIGSTDCGDGDSLPICTVSVSRPATIRQVTATRSAARHSRPRGPRLACAACRVPGIATWATGRHDCRAWLLTAVPTRNNSGGRQRSEASPTNAAWTLAGSSTARFGGFCGNVPKTVVFWDFQETVELMGQSTASKGTMGPFQPCWRSRRVALWITWLMLAGNSLLARLAA